VKRPSQLGWVDSDSLDYHFSEHGHEVGARTERDYVRSAQQTAQVGEYFTYRHGGRDRVERFNRRTGRLTVLTDDESAIVNHFVTTVEYVRNLPGSTYPH
jgi:hypothetical protein